MTVIKVFLVILSIIGYCLLFNKKFDIYIELTPILVISCISILLFIASLFTYLNYVTYILFIIGIILLILNFKRLINTRNIVFFSVMLISIFLLFVRVRNECLYDAGNLEFWGLRMKNLLVNNRLPIDGDPYRFGIMYPYGPSYWTYYFCKLTNDLDNMMILGFDIISVSSLLTLLVYVKEERKLLNTLIIIVSAIYLLTVNVGICTLTVETIMPILCIGAIVYFNKQYDSRTWYLSIPIFILIALCKNYGTLFSMFALILCFVNTNIKNICKIIIILVSTISSVLIWELYTFLNYGYSLILSKIGFIGGAIFFLLFVLISIVMYRKLRMITLNEKYKMWILIVTTIAIFVLLGTSYISLTKFPSVFRMFVGYVTPSTNNIIGYSILLPIFTIAIVFIVNIRNNIINKILSVLIIYIGFSLFLMIAYCIAFPANESTTNLASVDRYMLSVTILLIGYALVEYLSKGCGTKNSITAILLMVCVFISNPQYYKIYQQQTSEQRLDVYWFVKNQNLKPYKDYIIVSPPEFNDGLFKLCIDYDALARNMNIVDDNISNNLYYWEDNYDYLIIWNHNDESDYYLKANGYNEYIGKDRAVVPSKNRQ